MAKKNKKIDKKAPSPSLPKVKRAEILPLTDAQDRLIDSITYNVVTFASGSAGTGKTFVSAGCALKLLNTTPKGDDPAYKKIVLLRPTVAACNEDIGFLPGDKDEKLAPYMQHVYDAARKTGFPICDRKIEMQVISFLRGSSFDNCILLVDEAQNLLLEQFKLILTRIGKDSKVIFCGDPHQSDIGKEHLSAMRGIMRDMDDVDFVDFTSDDIVRSKFCKAIVKAFELYENK